MYKDRPYTMKGLKNRGSLRVGGETILGGEGRPVVKLIYMGGKGGKIPCHWRATKGPHHTEEIMRFKKKLINS